MKISDSTLNAIDNRLLELAFEEDLGAPPYQDLTSQLLFSHDDRTTTARIISKENKHVVLSGQNIAKKMAEKFNLQLDMHFEDSDLIPPGATICTLTGSPQALLMIERTLLNFLQRLCAIASKTQEFVNLIQHTSAKILDTRKTLPGFRHLEKYAVQCGGGVNHRMGLYDAIMIKDTHIDALGGIEKALMKVPKDLHRQYPIIVEVRHLTELRAALDHSDKITRVLLDNMSIPTLKECVHLCQGVLPTEASGNVSLTNVQAIAETGVDFISVGKITHSAGSVDLSMKSDL